MMNRIKPLLYLGVGVALLLLVAHLFSDIFLYFAISLVLTTILRPMVNYLDSLYFLGIKTPRIVAVFVSFLLLIGVIALFIGLFVPLVSEQIQLIGKLDYNSVYDKITGPLVSLEHFLIQSVPSITEPGFITGTLRDNITSFFQTLNFTSIINNVLSLTGTFFIGIIAVVFITFFLLYEKGLLRRNFISLIPNQYFEVSIAAVFKIEQLLSNYLLGLLFQMFSIFTIAAIGLSIFGIKYALTIAVFAAVANLIPYAGPLLGASFGIIVGISTSGLFDLNEQLFFLVIKIVSVFSVVQLIDNIFLQPLIFSKSVKAHPLEIFVIIFAGASLAGVPGMVVAIPVYTIIRVVIMELYRGYKQYHIFQN